MLRRTEGTEPIRPSETFSPKVVRGRSAAKFFIMSENDVPPSKVRSTVRPLAVGAVACP